MYKTSIPAKCIDHYTKLCVAMAEGGDGEQKPIDTRLESIVNRMFQRCFDDRQFKQAVGIALETRRIDIFERAILESVRTCAYMKSTATKSILSFMCLEFCSLVQCTP